MQSDSRNQQESSDEKEIEDDCFCPIFCQLIQFREQSLLNF